LLTFNFFYFTAEIEVTSETTPNGTVVHTITATDPEDDDVTFTMECAGCPFAMYPSKFRL